MHETCSNAHTGFCCTGMRCMLLSMHRPGFHFGADNSTTHTYILYTMRMTPEVYKTQSTSQVRPCTTHQVEHNSIATHCSAQLAPCTTSSPYFQHCNDAILKLRHNAGGVQQQRKKRSSSRAKTLPLCIHTARVMTQHDRHAQCKRNA